LAGSSADVLNRYSSLGNPRENALPYCQIRQLQSWADSLYIPSKRPVRWWIDTLCVPLDRTLRKLPWLKWVQSIAEHTPYWSSMPPSWPNQQRRLSRYNSCLVSRFQNDPDRKSSKVPHHGGLTLTLGSPEPPGLAASRCRVANRLECGVLEDRDPVLRNKESYAPLRDFAVRTFLATACVARASPSAA
jgi:hypothetical protein